MELAATLGVSATARTVIPASQSATIRLRNSIDKAFAIRVLLDQTLQKHKQAEHLNLNSKSTNGYESLTNSMDFDFVDPFSSVVVQLFLINHSPVNTGHAFG